ncbi:hypothetical protein TU81_25330 [Pseudomonas lini]|nr:hypothetical protein TU81_25330 [Pseudomonas lini]
MTKVGIKEYPLVEYLAGQLMLSDEDRLNALKEYVPSYGAQLNSNPAKVAEEWAYTSKMLELTPPPVIGQVAAPAAAPAAPAAPAKAPKANATTDMAL